MMNSIRFGAVTGTFSKPMKEVLPELQRVSHFVANQKGIDVSIRVYGEAATTEIREFGQWAPSARGAQTRERHNVFEIEASDPYTKSNEQAAESEIRTALLLLDSAKGIRVTA